MNDNAKKWVAALRSGRYEQTKGALERGGRYCCMGVACVVAMRAGVPLERTGSDSGTVAYNSCTGLLPSSVAAWLGLNDTGGDYLSGKLTDLNDRGTPFAQLAEIIESEPDGLFVKG